MAVTIREIPKEVQEILDRTNIKTTTGKLYYHVKNSDRLTKEVRHLERLVKDQKEQIEAYMLHFELINKAEVVKRRLGH